MKREPPQVLLQAIRKVLHGGLAFSDEVTARMLHGVSRSPTGETTLPSDRLSDRERQVLEMIGQGISTRTIAEKLHLSIKTVQAHRENIKVKLNLADGLSLTRFAVKWFESEEGTIQSRRPGAHPAATMARLAPSNDETLPGKHAGGGGI